MGNSGPYPFSRNGSRQRVQHDRLVGRVCLSENIPVFVKEEPGIFICGRAFCEEDLGGAIAPDGSVL